MFPVLWMLIFGLNAGAGLPAVPSPERDQRDAARPPIHDQDRQPAKPVHYTVALRWENDVIAGTDRNYSNGTSLTLSRDGRGVLGGIWGWFGAKNGRWITSYELGQIIVTPADITRPIPDPTDRPYAGLLYGALSTQFVHGHSFHGLKVITGMVGPASGAAQTQKAVHRVTGDPQPQGWDYQLKNEPILNLVYEHRRRFTLAQSDAGWSVQAIPVVGGMLGNVLIQAQANGQFRAGYHLPDDFGTTLMRGLGNLPFPRDPAETRAPRKFGAYLFAGGGANLVARNLSLDGNTFRDGPSVPKEPLFAAGEAGATIWTRWFEVTATYVMWGREFAAQTRASHFGAATVAIHF
jgi:lipid A 3-O-deacylase